MKCKNECGLDVTGKRQFCSDKCRKQFSRNSDKIEQSKSDKPQLGQATRTASLEDYKAHPELYAKRTWPDELNWGAYMTASQLTQAGFRANRVTLPGDHDYQGVCDYIDGQWTVSDKPAPSVEECIVNPASSTQTADLATCSDSRLEQHYAKQQSYNPTLVGTPPPVRPATKPERGTKDMGFQRCNDGLASDGYPIQHDNSMKVGYVPPHKAQH